MKNILFICHGNICRSPMAEFVMKDLMKKAGLASQFHTEYAPHLRRRLCRQLRSVFKKKF